MSVLAIYLCDYHGVAVEPARADEVRFGDVICRVPDGLPCRVTWSDAGERTRNRLRSARPVPDSARGPIEFNLHHLLLAVGGEVTDPFSSGQIYLPPGRIVYRRVAAPV